MRAVLLGSSLLMVAANGSAQEALNVAEWTAAIEILTNAKAILINDGWYQVQPTNEDTACLSTALELAWKSSGKTLVDFDYARYAIDIVISAPPPEKLTSESDPLPVPYWGRYYMYWNDAPGRKEEEVIGALDAAITLAEKERALAEQADVSEGSVIEFDAGMMETLGFK